MSLTKEDEERLALIKANRKRLNECKKHRFKLGELPYTLGTKFVCDNCAGVMPAVEAYQYILGYEAAGGNANDVAPGFRGENEA